MKNALTLTVLLAIVALCSVPAIGENIEPLTVSPGATDRFTGVEVRCPTFSWQAVPGASGYEVVVYELSPEVDLAAWSLDEAVEVLFVELPAGVTAWTPSFESGLIRGVRHVWYVRGVFEDGGATATPWSQGRFFRVVGEVRMEGAVTHSRDARGTSGTGTGTGAGTGGAISRGMKAEPKRSAAEKRVGEKGMKAEQGLVVAITGEVPDPSGPAYGVLGLSNSPDGGGVAGANLGGGPDVVLDGAADGQSDTLIFQDGIDRPSGGIESFTFENSGGGDMHLGVIGTIFGNGSGLVDVDAETLDGIDSSAFSPLAHLHDDRYYTEGELNTSGGGGSVHWDNLGAVPTGFADGIDHDTTYTAGTGLNLAATEFKIMGSGYSGLIVVAKSGGDFSSIQSAIDSISGATIGNQYLVWVAPGYYLGRVTLKPWVHLQGAGQGATEIATGTSSTAWPPDQPTLTLASNSSVRDISVSMTGSATWNTALLASAGTSNSTVSNVTATASGAGTLNYAAVLYGAGTEVELNDVTVLSHSATSNNYALYVWQGADVTLRGGTFTGRGGADAIGIYNSATDTSLIAHGVVAIGESGTSENIGFSNSNGGEAHLFGGTMTGRVSGALGVANDGSETSLEAVSVSAEGTFGALRNTGGASAVLNGGTFLGQWVGIETSGLTSALEATNVRVVAETTIGICVGIKASGASTILSNCLARAICRHDGTGIVSDGDRLEATGTTAEGQSTTGYGRGLYAHSNSTTIINGGSFVGRGGDSGARGIHVYGTGTTLNATAVSALGEEGAGYNAGLDGANSDVVLYGGTFTGRGGTFAYGVWGGQIGSGVLDATGITAVGREGSSQNRGLVCSSTVIKVGASQLVGGAWSTGTLTCFHVFDENFTSYTCP